MPGSLLHIDRLASGMSASRGSYDVIEMPPQPHFPLYCCILTLASPDGDKLVTSNSRLPFTNSAASAATRYFLLEAPKAPGMMLIGQA